jgi:hypothetical protein
LSILPTRCRESVSETIHGIEFLCGVPLCFVVIARNGVRTPAKLRRSPYHEIGLEVKPDLRGQCSRGNVVGSRES